MVETVLRLRGWQYLDADLHRTLLRIHQRYLLLQVSANSFHHIKYAINFLVDKLRTSTGKSFVILFTLIHLHFVTRSAIAYLVPYNKRYQILITCNIEIEFVYMPKHNENFPINLACKMLEYKCRWKSEFIWTSDWTQFQTFIIGMRQNTIGSIIEILQQLINL